MKSETLANQGKLLHFSPTPPKKKKKKKKKTGYIHLEYGVMVIIVGNGHSDTSSNPGRGDCISHSTNTLGKGMNPIGLPPAMGK